MTTYVLVAHSVVAELADGLVVLRAGRVIGAGPVGDVVTTPRTQYTQALLSV